MKKNIAFRISRSGGARNPRIFLRHLRLYAALAFVSACSGTVETPVSAGMGTHPALPAPSTTLLPTVNIAPAAGWPEATQPIPAPGLTVTAFASGLDHPRWLHVLPNGDVLVAETNAPERPLREKLLGLKGLAMKIVMQRVGAATPSANRITLLRDVDKDGVAEQRSIFIVGLNSPFGMQLVDNELYVANTDAIVRFPYRPGALRIDTPGVKTFLLPGGPLNHHWTKNLIANADGSKWYVAVGSNSNIAEHGMAYEHERAAILEFDSASGTKRLYASGLRNPVGMAWEGDVLWVSVNERDELGDNLVPDFLTSVREDGFYGWPYSYFGQHVDARVQPQRPDLVARAIKPDYALVLLCY